MKRALAFPLLIVAACFVFPFNSGSERGFSPSTLPHLSPHHRVGIYLTSYALTRPGFLNTVLGEIEAKKINALVINIKNMHGEVTYASTVPLAKEINAATGRLDLQTLIPLLHKQGVYLIARQVLFYDPKLASFLRISRPWIPPDNAQAVDYNLAIAQEAVSLGFDEIQFDYLRYADEGGLTPMYEDHYAAVNNFLAAAQRLLSGRVVLSIDVFGRVLWNWNKKRIDPIGQSLEEIVPYVNFVSPMLYPSHYTERRYKDDPYLVVTDALSTANKRVKAQFRPFLQAFDRDIPPGMTMEDYIRAQIRAAQEQKTDGYLFWNPSCAYAALYRALAD